MSDNTNTNIKDEKYPVSERMSKRLLAVAGMLSEGGFSCTADIGCDHGYISIYLVQSGISQKAIAMDVRKGPLSAAGDNIRSYGLEEHITTRLSDGLDKLNPGEADSAVIAGMGGKLMIDIIGDGRFEKLGIKRAVLQPQSDLSEFRSFLREKNYVILDEKIVLEDGKYYFPMLVDTAHDSSCAKEVYEELFSGCDKEMVLRVCDRYGKHNILRKDELLKQYLFHGKEVLESVKEKLDMKLHEGRYREVEAEISDIDFVLDLFTKQQ